MKKPLFITSLCLVAILVACGGGGGGEGPASQPAINTYTPSATVLAAKQANYATPFWAAGTVGGNGTCSGTDLSTTAYVLPNTITYAAKGVSELSQQQAAEYAEKAIVEVKAVLGISAGVGYAGKPVQVCAQTPLVFGSAQGTGSMKGLTVASSDSQNLDKGYLSNDFELYKKLIKHELVHVYHAVALDTDGAVLDLWFAEGLAEFIASGKSSKPKADVLALISTQTPIDITVPGQMLGNASFVQYPAFQSVVAYLFDPSGAKNNLTTLPAFMADLKTKLNTPIPPCTNAPCSIYSRDYAWDPAFEQHFKEADGSPMKIRKGTNNLRDTVSTRLSSFLQ